MSYSESPETACIQFFRSTVIGDGLLGPIATVDFVEPNLNLLAHAQTIELELGSRCGGHGKCGGDRIRISTLNQGALNLSAITESERIHLSSEELSSGIRLACQCFPDAPVSTLRVEIFPL